MDIKTCPDIKHKKNTFKNEKAANLKAVKKQKIKQHLGDFTGVHLIPRFSGGGCRGKSSYKHFTVHTDLHCGGHDVWSCLAMPPLVCCTNTDPGMGGSYIQTPLLLRVCISAGVSNSLQS